MWYIIWVVSLILGSTLSVHYAVRMEKEGKRKP